MTKSIFQSKTAAVALITTVTGIIAQFYPQVAEFVTDRSADILIALGMIGMILRIVTKDKISLFPNHD